MTGALSAAGQLSLALLADFFGSDVKAKAMWEVFEQHVISTLPDSWTLTEYALAAALAPLVGVDGVRAADVEKDGVAGAAFGDMPVASGDVPPTLGAEDAAAAGSMVNEGGHLAGL